MEKLDAIDQEILKLLQQNSSQTTKEIATKVNLSSTPVFERIKRLERDGFIKKYSAILDTEKFDSIIVFCNIRLKKHSKECHAHFTDAIEKIPEIIECYNISGDYDFMLKIIAGSMAKYQDFVTNVLGTIESVGSLHSLFVLKTMKDTHIIPIQSLQ